ncbi:hypothetical protein Godav_024702 [Gossypium davidsonii]|uniref:CCHC-type domain-containing protein n=1 Tax=Gossypium davidsonii TaxID=34287 RepID=A0A7J8T5S2_GOSDV|nr:hypothetical protein [Gossypium davidsonii]
MMVDDINALLENLKFLEEESVRVISSNMETNYQGFEAWAVGKIMAIEKPNKEAMYRVLRSLWLTKYEVNVVALTEEVIMVKFGYVEDRNRILNMMPWLFDNCLFAMLPFVKDKELETYEFNFSSFWLRIYNIPLEYMERQIDMDVGKAIGELVAIDWKDRNGGWTEVMRLKVKINVSNLLRRVVRLVGRNGVEMVYAIKFERLPAFCYYCGIIGHTTQKCKKKEEVSDSNNLGLQYGNWLWAPPMNPNQNRGIWRNGIEIASTQSIANDTNEESKSDTRE